MFRKPKKIDENEAPGQAILFSRIDAGAFPFLLLLPSIIVILLVIAFPLLYSLYVSFTPYHLLRPDSLTFTFSKALRNYEKLLNDDVFGARCGTRSFFWRCRST